MTEEHQCGCVCPVKIFEHEDEGAALHTRFEIVERAFDGAVTEVHRRVFGTTPRADQYGQQSLRIRLGV
jgi:hypothetical protein